ncbi:DUF2827 family protein [Candidatus Thioglobus sp.]|uniref:DUF2827 family protein n=1 Tax=Candidatus Thioglobus sp. TaxID=2026721 RepID=UPI003D124158
MAQKKYQIAISISDNISADSLYNNGISQNIVLLHDLFELLGHQVLLVNNRGHKNQKLKLDKGKEFSLYTVSELKKRDVAIDLFFEAGQVIPTKDRKLVKSLGAKIISIHYGNSLIIDMENIFYRDIKKAGFQNISDEIDHIWISPHHAYHLSYLEILYNAKASVVPFIWNPTFLEEKKLTPDNFRKKPNVYVMEPNISVVKNALIPLTIIEALYRQNPEKFDKAYIITSRPMHEKSYFINNILQNMDCLKGVSTKNKVFFSERCKFDDVFTHPDILLSHHWNNGLNYLSLEALHHNIPLVHNSEFLQDVGYFYPDFDVHKGAAALEDALENHQSNFTQHQQQNQVFLDRFSIYNKDVQKQYQTLLGDVINQPDKNTETVFTDIFQNNSWGVRRICFRQWLNFTRNKKVRQWLPDLIKKRAITSMLDAPCGDFNWMKQLDLADVDYIGADIVKTLVDKNIKNHSKNNVSFRQMDLIVDSLPTVDLILVRDCLVHFPYEKIMQTLKNICKSKSGYLLTTTFNQRENNKDIEFGQWHPINLEAAPFSLPKPLEFLNEDSQEENGLGRINNDKILALWKIKDLQEQLFPNLKNSSVNSQNAALN